MLTLHHTGILVKDMDEAIESYRGIFSADTVSEKMFISSQQVNVCFIKIQDEIYLELVQPTSDESPVNRIFNKGNTYYHIGYFTKTFDREIKLLEEKNYKLLSTFNSEAFNNHRCAFLMSPVLHLVELIESK